MGVIDSAVTLLGPLLRGAVGVLLALALIIYPFLYLMQDRMLFLRAGLSAQQLAWARAQAPDTEVRIPVADGVELHGWFVPAAGTAPAPLLIYFGGNAEEVSAMLAERPQLPGWALLLVNYRGYGLSGGAPSQAALSADALAVHDWAARRPEIDPARIVAWGRSLGTGVAVQLAAQRPLAGVLLVSPYDSMAAVAQRHYPFVPVRWLLRHPFDALALAPAIRTPALAIAMAHDEVVPAHHSRRLMAAWGGPQQLLVFDDGDHNTLPARAYWAAVTAFLAPLAQR